MSGRSEYDSEGLGETGLAAAPFPLIEAWVQEARARNATHADVPEPDALQLATSDADGHPDVRTVLMRFLDPRGPGFVTALTSTKSRQIAQQPHVAGALVWPSMYRAIRFRGVAQAVETDLVRDYFYQRPWSSRISAWASQQSEPAESRAELERAHLEYERRFPDHGRPDDVPVPDHWGAWRIVADRVEFWAGRRSRLHDRIVYTRSTPADLADPTAWTRGRLQP